MLHALLAAGLAGMVGCKAPPLPPPDEGPAGPEVETPPTVPVGGFEVSEGSADAGTVQRGEWATHVFSITNKSDRVMHVKNVRGT